MTAAVSRAVGMVGQSEADSLSELDGLMVTHKLVNPGCLYKEVDGFVDQPRFLSQDKPIIRIDRIYSPSSRLVAAGWPHGPIGVEAKRPGESLGKAFAQAMDYSRATFTIRPGFHIKLEWIFLWPFEAQEGDMASVMAQHRIGCVNTGRWYQLRFSAAKGLNGIEVGNDGKLFARAFPCGKKRGAR